MKKILLIMPNFFEYPENIISELRNMNYDVDFYDDRPSTNSFVKALVRINPDVIRTYIRNYLFKIIKETKCKQYDILFLISGQSLSFDGDMMKEFKKTQPNAMFVLYQWDSLKNFKRVTSIYEYFDKKYSFDRYDCLLNDELIFLPLFYSPKYKEIGDKNIKMYKYDLCFVGTAHPKKYKLISRMATQLKEKFPNQFIYFFLPSPIVYLYRKVMNIEFRNSKYYEFNYKSMKEEILENLFCDSYCILDSPQDGQIGLTMRVFEMLGAKKKLITTNEDVINYDFYKKENIYIYSGEIDFNDIFFKTDYVEIEKKVYYKYSLNSWLKEILSEVGK
ncbi:MAG: hypothetical protein RR623_04390 [Bacilli bacterium]